MSLSFSPTLGFVRSGNFVDSVEAKQVYTNALFVDGDMIVDGTTSFDSLVTFGAGVQYENATVGYVPTTMNYNEEGTIVTTWSGIWGSPQPGNVDFSRRGNDVRLTLPNVLAMSSAPGQISMDTQLPPRLWPPATVFQIIRIRDDVTIQAGLVMVDNAGFITVFADPSGGNFTGGGVATAGFFRSTVPYQSVP